MKCPNCNKEIDCSEADAFCPECGGALPAAETADAVGATGEQQRSANPFSNVDFNKIFADVSSSSPKVEAEEMTQRSTVAVTDEVPQNASANPFSGVDFNKIFSDMAPSSKRGMSDTMSIPITSECSCARVEYNSNLFLLSGSQALLRLRLTPLSGELRKVFVYMETLETGHIVRQSIPVRTILLAGRPIDLSCQYAPTSVSGTMKFNFYVECQLPQETKFYSFSVAHKVYDPSQSAGSLGQVIVNQNFGDRSYVGEIHMEAVRDIVRKTPPSAYELIEQLNSLPPVYEVKNLFETTWRPDIMDFKGKVYPLDERRRLALEWNGNTIFMTAKTAVKLGRSPERADILVRTGGGRIDSSVHPNRTVSRCHAEVHYGKDAVTLFDRSSYGTYINGVRPDEPGVSIASDSTVEFGDIAWYMRIQHCMGGGTEPFCQTCNACKVKSVTFSPKRDEREFFLLVWQCCELGPVIGALSGWTVFFHDNAFFLQTPDSQVYALAPGQTIECNNQKVQVKYFQQN